MNFSAAAKVVTEGAAHAAKWASQNPKSAAAYGLAGTAMIVPAAIAGPALAAAGFGANGIVGASIASGAQASIGNVAAGSLFATLQSAGMAGYGAAIVNGVIQAGGAVAAIATGGAAAMQANTRKHPRKTGLILVENAWALLRSVVKVDLNDCDAASDGGINTTNMEDALEKSWVCMPPDVLKELSKSIPEQIDAFTKRDGSTEY